MRKSMPPRGARWATATMLAKMTKGGMFMLSDPTIRRDPPASLPRRWLLAFRKAISTRYRTKLNSEIRNVLKGVRPFTIFSNNCLGGVFYSDSGQQFTSPLINTAMDGKDFLKFLSNPRYYLNHEMDFFAWPGRDFPIARLDDIEVNFVHYKTPEECVEKWKTRAERIVWDNIFIIATNHDGMCHDECMEMFDKLPYKNKIMFVTKEYPQYDWAIPVYQFKNRFQCRVMTSFADMKGHRYYETAFDIAHWIQKNSV